MKVLVFSDKSKAEIIDENGKYYITKKSKFRKNNPDILAVIEKADGTDDAAAEKLAKEKAKAKKSASKKEGE